MSIIADIPPTMIYKEETETYREKLPELLAEPGKFAVLRGKTLLGTYGTYEDALKAGYREYKQDPFLVKRIEALERIQYFTRALAPA